MHLTNFQHFYWKIECSYGICFMRFNTCLCKRLVIVSVKVFIAWFRGRNKLNCCLKNKKANETGLISSRLTSIDTIIFVRCLYFRRAYTTNYQPYLLYAVNWDKKVDFNLIKIISYLDDQLTCFRKIPELNLTEKYRIQGEFQDPSFLSAWIPLVNISPLDMFGYDS